MNVKEGEWGWEGGIRHQRNSVICLLAGLCFRLIPVLSIYGLAIDRGQEVYADVDDSHSHLCMSKYDKQTSEYLRGPCEQQAKKCPPIKAGEWSGWAIPSRSIQFPFPPILQARMHPAMRVLLRPLKPVAGSMALRQ